MNYGCALCRTITHGVRIVYQHFRSFLPHKQEVSDTANCLDTAFYILPFYVLMLRLYFNFNLNNFINIIHHLTVIKS
jgi:hypothetical protein